MKRWEFRPQKGHLILADVAIPEPGPREILVEVRAVSLNYRDGALLGGAMASAPADVMVPGSDMSGDVVAVGSDTTRFSPGDRVISADTMNWIDGPAPPYETNSVPILGRLAEYVCVHEEQLVSPPQSLTHVEASTLPVAGLTAWFAMVELGRVRAGQTVIVQGTGGVSLFAIQFAVAHGARVIVVTSSADKIERAKALGAADGIDRQTSPDWDQKVLEMTGGLGAHHVVEMSGGDNVARSVEALALGGRISLVGLMGSTEMRAPIIPMLFKRAEIVAIGVGHRRAQEDMVTAIDQLGLRPVIDEIYSFEHAPEAIEHLRRGPFGKVVVSLSRAEFARGGTTPLRANSKDGGEKAL